jgi:hypothetical protein
MSTSNHPPIVRNKRKYPIMRAESDSKIKKMMFFFEKTVYSNSI